MQLMRAYIVTTDTGAQVTYQAKNAPDARRIAEGEGHTVIGVFRE
jgi:hypothetical protein